MKTKSARPRSRKTFATIWGDLEYVCRKVHHWLYEKRDETVARRYRNRLQRLLDEVPKSDLAILRAEGLALLHELKGDNSAAIKHRKREIELMKRLQTSVDESVQAGKYDIKMAESILSNRDTRSLQVRRKILRTLEHD